MHFYLVNVDSLSHLYPTAHTSCIYPSRRLSAHCAHSCLVPSSRMEDDDYLVVEEDEALRAQGVDCESPVVTIMQEWRGGTESLKVVSSIRWCMP